MEAISVDALDPQSCVRKLYSRGVSYFKSDRYPEVQGILADPVDPAVLVAQYQSLGKEKLSASEFADLVYKTAQLRKNVHKILENRGNVIVLLRPCRYMVHESHPDVKINNYEWLWPGAGEDRRLHLIATADGYTLSEYGGDSPLREYLEMNLRIETAGDGEIYPLARDSQGNAVSFVILEKNGKIVFVPPSSGECGKVGLLSSLKEIFNPESWPSVTSALSIEPAWLENYRMPNIDLLEKALVEKEEQIARLEEDCENIHRNLLHLKKLQRDLLCSDATSMSRALFAILSQWGAEAFVYGENLRVVLNMREALILCFLSDETVPLWVGKKLARAAAGKKGVLVANAYQNIEPQQKDLPLYSKDLIEFATSHELALVSSWDVFSAYCLGRKELLELILTESGIVSPDYSESRRSRGERD